MGAHDFDVQYLERDLGEVAAEFTQTSTADGKSVVVKGKCPQCSGDTATEYSWGVPGTGTKGVFTKRAKEVPDVLRTEVLFCECGYVHPNQPANPVFLGCGASWRVRPEVAE